MFTPKLSPAQRRAVTDLRSRLAAALQPTVVGQPPELAPLLAKRAEKVAEIEHRERGVSVADLENAAAVVANLREQVRLIDLEIGKVNAAQKEAAAITGKQSADALADACAGARELLRQVATDFHDQHRAWFEGVAVRYAIGPVPAPQIVNLFPFFLTYKKAIRRFEQNGAESKDLLEWLDEALAGRDFLMHKI